MLLDQDSPRGQQDMQLLHAGVTPGVADEDTVDTDLEAVVAQGHGLSHDHVGEAGVAREGGAAGNGLASSTTSLEVARMETIAPSHILEAGVEGTARAALLAEACPKVDGALPLLSQPHGVQGAHGAPTRQGRIFVAPGSRRMESVNLEMIVTGHMT